MSEIATPKDAHVIERLRTEIIVWLSTTRPDGKPNLTPVWFLWEDPTILIFSQPKKQKVRNIQQNPNVMLGLETRDYGDDVVLIEGTAELLDNNPNLGMSLPGYVEKYGKLMERMKITPEQIAAEYSQPIRITPAKIRNWT